MKQRGRAPTPGWFPTSSPYPDRRRRVRGDATRQDKELETRTTACTGYWWSSCPQESTRGRILGRGQSREGRGRPAPRPTSRDSFSTATHSSHGGETRLDGPTVDTPSTCRARLRVCIELLDRIGYDIEGKKGQWSSGRSNLVGLPVAMLLVHRKCHRHDRSLAHKSTWGTS